MCTSPSPSPLLLSASRGDGTSLWQGLLSGRADAAASTIHSLHMPGEADVEGCHVDVMAAAMHVELDTAGAPLAPARAHAML